MHRQNQYRTDLNSLKTQLKKVFGNKFFYEVAEHAQEALELIEELTEDNIEIAVIISDEIIKIMLTGQADEEAIGRAQQWEGEVLIQTLKTALNLD